MKYSVKSKILTIFKFCILKNTLQYGMFCMHSYSVLWVSMMFIEAPTAQSSLLQNVSITVVIIINFYMWL